MHPMLCTLVSASLMTLGALAPDAARAAPVPAPATEATTEARLLWGLGVIGVGVPEADAWMLGGELTLSFESGQWAAVLGVRAAVDMASFLRPGALGQGSLGGRYFLTGDSAPFLGAGLDLTHTESHHERWSVVLEPTFGGYAEAGWAWGRHGDDRFMLAFRLTAPFETARRSEDDVEGRTERPYVLPMAVAATWLW